MFSERFYVDDCHDFGYDTFPASQIWARGDTRRVVRATETSGSKRGEEVLRTAVEAW
jgi:hypothetical protein